MPEESDFEKCYHALNDIKIQLHGRKYIAMRSDGTNQSAPQNQPNSKGRSFNAEMLDAIRAIDAVDQWAKRKIETDKTEE